MAEPKPKPPAGVFNSLPPTLGIVNVLPGDGKGWRYIDEATPDAGVTNGILYMNTKAWIRLYEDARKRGLF